MAAAPSCGMLLRLAPFDRGERCQHAAYAPTGERELTGNNGPVSLRSENPAEAGTQDNQGGF